MMNTIAQRLDAIASALGNSRLIAVTKTHPVATLQEAYDAGARLFGENKVQEILTKQPHLPQDIDWHLIGHLQSNKVKYIAPFIGMIHSVDSLSLLKEINKQAAKNQRIIKCLVQVHIAQEETKFGLGLDEITAFLASPEIPTFENIAIVGLMGMATFTDDTAQIRTEFRSLKSCFDTLKNSVLPHNVCMEELSMGMSGDYLIAIEEGSTLVRVGSAIFGSRPTSPH